MKGTPLETKAFRSIATHLFVNFAARNQIEQAMVYICQVVSELAELFELDEEKVMSKLIAENQAFTKAINLKTLLQAG